MQIEWVHIAVEGAVVVGPLLGGGYLAFRKLMWVLSEFRPHAHTERKSPDSKGPLFAENIVFPRSMNGRE